MVTLGQIARSQAKYGVGTEIKNFESVPYITYLSSVRTELTTLTSQEYYSWDTKKQNDYTEALITEYVNRHPRSVDGYVNIETGDLLIDELLDALRKDILESGILKYALEDPEVQEIQINDCKTIYVVKRGIIEPYADTTGTLLQFEDDAELVATLDRMIYSPDGDSPRMTQTHPYINARTQQKGYRISAVDSSAQTRDITAGYDFPVTSCTLRKYSDFRFVFDDFIGFESMTPKMVRFLRLCSIADLKIFFIGKTSSGKTTLAQAVLDYFLDISEKRGSKKRIICIQNPTEMTFYRRSRETQANSVNVLHWEVREVNSKHKDNSSTPTMSHALALALRHSPDIIVPGELRLPEEFAQVYNALKFDQRVISTFHSGSGEEGLLRFGSEVASINGGSLKDYLPSLASSIDIFISQNRLDDGRRKVMGIEEVTGNILENGMPEINKIAGFNVTGDTKFYDDGRIEEIKGSFFDSGFITSALAKKFYLAGITKTELAEFLREEDR